MSHFRWLRRLHLSLFVVVILAWTIALLSPVPEAEAEQVLGSKEGMFYFGKTLHVVAYLLLTLFAGVMSYARCTWPWLAFGMFLHGGLIEILQPYVGRNGRWQDWCLDATGVLIASLLVWLWWRFQAAGFANPVASVTAAGRPNTHSTPTNPSPPN